MFSLESPRRGDSNEYTQHAIINVKKTITLNYPKYIIVCSYGIFFFQGTQERVRNIRGKRAISVRAIEVLLYVEKNCCNVISEAKTTLQSNRIDLTIMVHFHKVYRVSRISTIYIIIDTCLIHILCETKLTSSVYAL